jgi:hypothetical protein
MPIRIETEDLQPQRATHSKLVDELSTLPTVCHNLPFHDCIHQSTDVISLKAETEQMLWHQRLGHPSDYYLHDAREHIDGVPKFSHMDPVLDKCHTCIQAKQIKEPAGKNTTRVATRPYQRLPIDFAFAGAKSQDDKRKENFTGINGET